MATATTPGDAMDAASGGPSMQSLDVFVPDVVQLPDTSREATLGDAVVDAGRDVVPDAVASSDADAGAVPLCPGSDVGYECAPAPRTCEDARTAVMAASEVPCCRDEDCSVFRLGCTSVAAVVTMSAALACAKRGCEWTGGFCGGTCSALGARCVAGRCQLVGWGCAA